jgi:hypothetical protein
MIYKILHTIQDRATRTPLKIGGGGGGELMCSGRMCSSCSTSCTRRVTRITNPVISREWEKDLVMITTNGTHSWSFVTKIFFND